MSVSTSHARTSRAAQNRLESQSTSARFTGKSALVSGLMLTALALTACQAPLHGQLVGQDANNSGIVNGQVGTVADVSPQGIAESVVMIETKMHPKGGALCTGTLISPVAVLTAAHCVPTGTTAADITVILHVLNARVDSGNKVYAFHVNSFAVKPSADVPGGKKKNSKTMLPYFC